jgi:hypothetical protein
MQPHRLTEQMLDPGQRLAHYFNGRLLSAEDLGLERAAQRHTLRRLGQALGEGIATGLEVSVARQQPAVVRVAPGFAFARDGTALEIPADAGAVEVELALPAAVAPTRSGDGKFGNCSPLTSPGFTGQAGWYLLVLSPTQGPEGLARVMGLPGETVRCNTRYEVLGVVFDLIQLQVPGLAPGSPQASSRFAARCFGLPPVTLRGAGTQRGDTLLDALRPHLLPACSAPLAAVYLTATGLQVLDLWAARRRLTAVGDLARWAPLLGERRAAELEAMALHFADQLQARLARPGTDATKLEAQEDFVWLPSAGLLPAAMDWKVFLGPHAPLAATPLRADLIRAKFLEALAREPFAVADFANAQTPAPVEVFAPEPPTGFVLFTRSGLGRVRVFGEPAEELAARGFVAELRGTRGWQLGALSAIGARTQFDAAPADVATLALTAEGFQTPDNFNVVLIEGQTTDLRVTFEPLPKGALLVTVRDPEGKPAGLRVSRVTATREGTGTDGLRLGDGNWQVPELDDGTYSLTVVAAGFHDATTSGLQVRRGFTTQVEVELVAVPRADPPFCQRVRAAAAQGWAGRLCLLPKLIHLPRFVLDWPLDRVASSAVKWPAFDFRRAEKGGVLVDIEVETAAFFAADTEPASGTAASKPMFLRLDPREKGVARLQDKLKLKPAAPPPWKDFEPVVLKEFASNASEIERWLGTWRDALAADHPGYAIERATPGLRVARTARGFTHMGTPDKPYAWAVFGSVGVPVVVTPEREILPLPVRPEVVLPGRTWLFHERLKDFDILLADQIPHLWTGLFEDLQVTDPTPEFGPEVLTDARGMVTHIQTERLYFPDVRAEDLSRLRDTPFATDVGLANANLTELTAALGGNAALARQLIRNARQAVTPDSWSLRGLADLDDRTLAGLRAQGVNSLGQLTGFAGTDAGRTALTQLGVSADRVGQWTATAETRVLTGAREEFGRNRLLHVAGDAATAEALERGGFSAESTATAQPAEVAAKTGLTETQAREVIGKAQAGGTGEVAIGVVLPTLSVAERDALEAAGVRTVSDLKGLSETRLTTLLGGNTKRVTLVRGAFRTP